MLSDLTRLLPQRPTGDARPSHRLLFLVAGLALAMLAGCAAVAPPVVPAPATQSAVAETPTARGSGGKLRILFWQKPSILNPHLASGAVNFEVSRLFYEPLASFDESGNLVPILAAEIPSLDGQGNGGVASDGKSVTWKLKQNVQWQDGTPFTADDVVFTYEYISDPETRATTADTYAEVASVEALDPYTVRINFRGVNPAWSLPFTGMRGAILPRHVFEPYKGAKAADAPPNNAPVGTGPYKVVKFQPQEVLLLGNDLMETNKLVLEPNETYREPDKPHFRRIEVKGGGTSDEAARLVSLGEVDFAFNLQLNADTMSNFGPDSRGSIVAVPGPFVERILINRTDPNRETSDGERSSLQFEHPMFSDKRVRQALSYAIDRAAIADLYGSAGKPSSNLLVSPERFRSSNTSYEYNPDKAKALLEEAGWVDSNGDGTREKDGVKMSIVFQTSQNAIRQQTQALVKKDLEAIGMEVELKFLDSGTFFNHEPENTSNIFHFYADLEEFADGNSSPDPGAYMKFWTCAQIPQNSNEWSGQNAERWCNAEYDKLYARSAVEIDPDKRRDLFIQMNDLYVEDVVGIPLVHRALTHGISNDLEGVDFTPWDATLWNIENWRREVAP